MYSDIVSKIAKPVNLLLFCIIIFSVLYVSTFYDLFRSWVAGTGAYSHGLLLFTVCCYFFYKAWELNRSYLALCFSYSGMALLAGCSLIWCVARLLLIDTIQILLIPFLLFFIIVSLLGWKQSRIFIFPVSLLLLAMPLFDWLVPFLQIITANMTGVLLNLVGISSLVEGVLIFVPAGTFEIDTGCSGLNVFYVGIILSVLYAYMNYFSMRKGVLLVLSGVAVSIISNMIRVFIIAVVGNATQMQHPLVHDHANLGWLVFMIVYGIFYFVVNRYWHIQDRSSETDVLIQSGRIYRPGQIFMLSMMVIIGVGFGPVLAYGVGAGVGVGAVMTDAAREVPDNLGAWVSINEPVEKWRTKFSGGEGDFVSSKTYRNISGHKAYLVRRYYARQSIGNEAINTTNAVYDRQVWTRVWQKLYSWNQVNSTSSGVEETLVRGALNQEVLIWRWYSSFGKKTGVRLAGKVYNLFGILAGKPSMYVYVIASNVTQSYDDSRRLLEDFYVHVNQSINDN